MSLLISQIGKLIYNNGNVPSIAETFKEHYVSCYENTVAIGVPAYNNVGIVYVYKVTKGTDLQRDTDSSCL